MRKKIIFQLTIRNFREKKTHASLKSNQAGVQPHLIQQL